MVGTRRASKRLSQKQVEVPKNNIENKKRKVEPRKSIYFDPGESDSDSDLDEDLSQNDFIKMEADSTIKASKERSNSNLKVKDESLSESESSSDEFKKAPFSLDELGDFEVYKKDVAEKESTIQNGNLESVSRLSDDSDIEDKPKPNREYYDFSQIIKTQELITTMKKEFDEVKYEEQEASTSSKVTLPNLKTKSIKTKTKPRRPTTKRSNEGNKEASITNDLNVSQLLAMAEGISLEKNEDESDESQQEDVEMSHQISKEGVEVTIQLPNMRQKKKAKIDVEAAMKRRINLIRKDNQVLMHKVHLLCWIAHGNYLNNLINNDELMGLSLSLIPSQHCYPPKHTNLNYLEKLVEWFIKKLEVNEEHKQAIICSNRTTVESLQRQIDIKVVFSHKDLVLIFVCMIRSLGIHARLVVSLRAVPLKPPAEDLFVVSSKLKTEEKDLKSQTKKVPATKTSGKSKLNIKKNLEKKEMAVKLETNKKNTTRSSKSTGGKAIVKTESNNSPYFSSSDEKPLKKKDETEASSSQYFSPAGKKLLKKRDPTKTNSLHSNSSDKTPSKCTVNASKYFTSSDKKPLKNKVGSDENKRTKSQYFSLADKEEPSSSQSKQSASKSLSKADKTETKPILSNIKRPQRERKSKSYTEENSSSGEDDDKAEKSTRKKLFKNRKESNQVTPPAVQLNDGKTLSKNRGSLSNKKKTDDDGSDDTFEPSSLKKRNRKSIDRRILSSDDEAVDVSKKKIGVDYWVEVFLEEEEKWISVDLTRGRVHCVHKIYNLATSPVRYVLAWNNNKTIKDITRRYTPHWLTVTRKQRVDQDWWDETVAPYAPFKNAREREEDEDLDRQLQDKPLPTSVSEYKNHPLYALSRHLLKFEAIYPADAPTVGFVRGEPVYSRSCIVTLHTRETWMREAKCVMIGEEPYKIVKARPKYDKLSGNVINNLPLPLFGYWQVEDYKPPPAVDGKVPRNEYGNVELYKPCMLPPGTVHLQIPCVNRVARKLNIDCAPAVTGWEYHCGGSHPILDGFIICEEHKDALLEAWSQEMDDSARRAKEKIEQRVYGNWRRLIRGLMIRERLKLRYDFGPVPSEPEKTTKKKSKPRQSKSK